MTMRKLFAAVSLSVLLLAPASAESAQQEVLIGLVPELNVFAQMERFKALADYLTEKTGIKVNLTILSRYGNIIDSFEAKKLDGAFFGSFTGALGIAKLDLEPLARPVNLDGNSTYKGFIFVRKDSGIRTAADMKGKRIAFVEKATTAGYIFPVAWLREQGISDLNTLFREQYFAGSHDAAINAVLHKEADVGAAKNTVYHIQRQKDPQIDKELLIIAESPAVPSNGLCMRKTLPPAVRQKLKEALLSIDRDSKGRDVLKKFYALKFVETTFNDYRPVFDLAQKAGIDLKTYQYNNAPIPKDAPKQKPAK